jgi:hypothetical protein
MTGSRSPESLTAADFRDIKGSRFRLESLEFEVADVIEAAASPSATFRAPFSVLFHGPMEPILPQAIYRLEHDEFGSIDLFLVPVGPDPSAGPAAMRYEAVFG